MWGPQHLLSVTLVPCVLLWSPMTPCPASSPQHGSGTEVRSGCCAGDATWNRLVPAHCHDWPLGDRDGLECPLTGTGDSVMVHLSFRSADVSLRQTDRVKQTEGTAQPGPPVPPGGRWGPGKGQNQALIVKGDPPPAAPASPQGTEGKLRLTFVRPGPGPEVPCDPGDPKFHEAPASWTVPCKCQGTWGAMR